MQREFVTEAVGVAAEVQPDLELVERVLYMADVGTEAADTMRQGFYAPRDEVGSRTKGDGSVVTDINEKIQRDANKACAAQGDAAVGKEDSTDTHEQDAWRIDPLDGTSDFDRRRGHRPTSIAAFSAGWVTAEKPGSPTAHTSRAGVIELPLLERPASFLAIEGQGAFCAQDGEVRKLEIDTSPTRGVVLVSGRPSAQPYIDALEKTGFATVRADGAVFKGCLLVDPSLAKEYLQTHADSLSASEQVALQGVVSGVRRIVGSVSANTYAHDRAATSRLVLEAGGLVCAPDGSELKFGPGALGSVFANNSTVQEELIGALQSALRD